METGDWELDPVSPRREGAEGGLEKISNSRESGEWRMETGSRSL